MRSAAILTPVLSVVLLCGCNGAQVGGPCSATKGCGDGAVCDLTDPGGPICVDEDGDIDGDGIPNKLDHCQHLAGGQFDEDQDGLGDECDPCPIAKPLGDPDPDGDEVDAPCDPDPRTPGDRIALFNGFNGPLPTGWKTTPGFQILGGAAVVTPATPDAIDELTAPLPLLTTHMAVLASYRIDKTIDGATSSFAGVIAIDARPAGGSRNECTGRRVGTSDGLAMITDRENDVKAFTNLFSPASLYEMTEKIDDAQGACAMIADNEQGAVQAATDGQAPTAAGFTVHGAVVRFGYLLVVQRP